MPHEERLAQLARLIAYADRRRDARAAAERLCAAFGSISAVYDAHWQEILRTGLVSRRAARLLCLTPALVRFVQLEALGERPQLDRFSLARAYLAGAFVGLRHEQMCVLALDAELRLIACHADSERRLREAPLNLRQILSVALTDGVAALILAHNHPGGSGHFSPHDVFATQNLLPLLSLIRTPLLDHILVTDERQLSMRSLAYLPERSWRRIGSPSPRRSHWLR